MVVAVLRPALVAGQYEQLRAGLAVPGAADIGGEAEPVAAHPPRELIGWIDPAVRPRLLLQPLDRHDEEHGDAGLVQLVRLFLFDQPQVPVPKTPHRPAGNPPP